MKADFRLQPFESVNRNGEFVSGISDDFKRKSPLLPGAPRATQVCVCSSLYEGRLERMEINAKRTFKCQARRRLIIKQINGRLWLASDNERASAVELRWTSE